MNINKYKAKVKSNSKNNKYFTNYFQIRFNANMFNAIINEIDINIYEINTTTK